jgi:hypothetical protein
MACGGQLLVNGLKLKEQSLYRGPSKDVPYQVLIHLAKWFQIKQTWPSQAILVSDWCISKNLLL